MTPLAAPARHALLIIVQPDRPDLFPRLRAEFGDATIIYDRRRADRRQTTRAVAVERREGRDRRQPMTESEERLDRQRGYRIVYRTEEPT